MIGQTVAHYENTDKIGAGGMGEVYRATDARLNREVALKVLPQVFVQDAQRMGRFERDPSPRDGTGGRRGSFGADRWYDQFPLGEWAVSLRISIEPSISLFYSQSPFAGNAPSERGRVVGDRDGSGNG